MQSLRQDLVNIFVSFGPWTYEGFNQLKDSLTGVVEDDPYLLTRLELLDREYYSPEESKKIEAERVEDHLIDALSDAWHLFSVEELKKIHRSSKEGLYGRRLASQVIPAELDRLERGQFMSAFEDKDPQMIADLAREYLDRVGSETKLTPQMIKAAIRLIDAFKVLPK